MRQPVGEPSPQETPWGVTKCMCGGDDHLAWKHPVFSVACRGLHTAPEGTITCARDSLNPPTYFLEPTLSLQVVLRSFYQEFPSYTWVHLRAFRGHSNHSQDPNTPSIWFLSRMFRVWWFFEFQWTSLSCRIGFLPIVQIRVLFSCFPCVVSYSVIFFLSQHSLVCCHRD